MTLKFGGGLSSPLREAKKCQKLTHKVFFSLRTYQSALFAMQYFTELCCEYLLNEFYGKECRDITKEPFLSMSDHICGIKLMVKMAKNRFYVIFLPKKCPL